MQRRVQQVCIEIYSERQVPVDESPPSNPHLNQHSDPKPVAHGQTFEP